LRFNLEEIAFLLLMRYSFILVVCIVLLISCGTEDGTRGGDNPVLGVWESFHEDTDSLVMRRVFTYDFYSYFSYAEGKSQNEYNKQEYSVYGNELLLEKYTQTFMIEGDILWITNSSNDQTTKYIKQKSLFYPID